MLKIKPDVMEAVIQVLELTIAARQSKYRWS